VTGPGGRIDGLHGPAFQRVEDALRAHGSRTTGRGRWQCPVREGHSTGDSNPSLSIKDGDRCALVHCFAGCSTEDVLATLGLTMQDLFDDPPAKPNGSGQSGQSAQRAKHIKTTYDYTDATGALRYQTVRYEPKDFRQRRPDGNDWIWDLKGVELLLYRLPELLKALAAGDTVYIVEGEKDADAVHKLGSVATCNPLGAGKWKPEFSAIFAGTNSKIIVVADQDEPGKRHADVVIASLRAVGVKPELRAPAVGKDTTDHLEGGKTLAELVDPIAIPVVSAKEIIMDVPSAERFVLHGLIPVGSLCLLTAKPKVGKSTFARALALAVSRGDEFLGRSTLAGRVLYLALEERRQDVREHFVRMGLEPTDQVDFFFGPVDDGFQEKLDRLIGHQHPRLIVADTLARLCPEISRSGPGAWNDYAVTGALEPLLSIAHGHETAILLIHHARKAQVEDAQDAVLGSQGIVGSVDVALMLSLSGENRLLSAIGRNVSMEPTLLEMDESGLLSLGPLAASANLERVCKEIVAVLAKSPPLEAKDIKCRGSRTIMYEALKKLLADGTIERSSGSGKRNDPFVYALKGHGDPELL